MNTVKNEPIAPETNDTFEPNPLAVLVSSVFDEKPQDFIDTYQELMQQKVSELVAQRKVDMQQSIFGGQEIEEPEEIVEPELEQDTNGQETT